MTGADLTNSFIKPWRCPGRNSTSSFAPYLTVSSVPCNPVTRLKSADSEVSTRANDVGA
jgi:hypothetical protein